MRSVCQPTLECRGHELLEQELRLHERVVARDQEALLEWLNVVGGVVYATVLSYMGDAATAEDETAALFLEVWRHPAMFHPTRGPLVLQLLRRMREDLVATRPAT